jgi:large subunit ribosomal protein L15
MQLSNLKPKTTRKHPKRIGRGGKRGTTSGGGTKGQKSRAGASVRPGFRGGDNRIWQLFPKSRGATKKHGNKSPHHKHRYFRVANTTKPWVVNLRDLVPFKEGDTVNPTTLLEKGLIGGAGVVKILGTGELKKKLTFTDVVVSKSARSAIEQQGGTIGA